MKNGITQHYWAAGKEAQALHLAEWTEARRREGRLTILPNTETQQFIQLQKMIWSMTMIGLTAAAGAVIGIVALMIYHFNWWVIPALISAVGLGILIKKLGFR